MSLPTTGAERARHDIAQAFSQYDVFENLNKMISTTVLSYHNVMTPNGDYPVIPIKQWMANPQNPGSQAAGHAARRAPSGAYVESDMSFTEATYKTLEHGLTGVLDETMLNHYRSVYDWEVAIAARELHKLLVQQEIRAAAALFSTVTFPASAYTGQSMDAGEYRDDLTTVGTAVPWSDLAASTPIRDVAVAQRKVFNKFGYYPKTMIVNETTMNLLRRNAELATKWEASGAGMVTTQPAMTNAKIAEVLNLHEILVGAAVQDSAGPAAAFAGAHIWGNGALICKRCTTGDIAEVGLGHTFRWTGDTAMNSPTVSSTFDASGGVFVEEYYDVNIRRRKLRVRHQNGVEIKYAIGEFITNTI